MSSSEHDIRVLNSLIETVIDSANGYQEAAKDSDGSRFYEIFQRRGGERQDLTRTLQGQVRALGGNPEDDGTVLAGAHRLFVNLRNAVAGGDKAVIEEVERGEDHIKHKFEDALQDLELGAAARAVIANAYEIVKAGHEEVRDLKRSLSSTY